MEIVEQVINFVEAECKKPTSMYGYEPFNCHFKPVVKNSILLAQKLNADEEIVEIAAWLHDIGSIVKGRKDHHITGAEIAGEKLKELGYPEEKILAVKKCILNHRGSVKNEKGCVEEKIIADADALANFDNISGIFKAAFVYEKLGQLEAKKSVFGKLKRSWEKLSLSESREIIWPKYEAALLLFGSEGEIDAN